MKNFNPKKYGDFTRGEIIAIIQLSCAMLSYPEIKNKFFDFTEKKKRLTSDQLIEIQADFSADIFKKSAEYLKNVKGNKFAHDRIILDCCLDIYNEARKKTPSGSVRTADNTYEVIEKEDLKTALAAVKLATDYLLNVKKLEHELDKRKEQIPDSIPVEWELDNGE